MESEPFETMESLNIADIDDYLNALLRKYKNTVGPVNFMESPRNRKTSD